MAYLDQELTILPDRITVKDSNIQVMMLWEQPLMQRMAEIACHNRGDILEIGFGMGLSCDAVQALKPKSHTIIEAHPQILERAQAWAEDKSNTQIIAGRWQEHIEKIGPFDGISFDVFGGDGQRDAFFTHLHRLLKPGGRATLWLGDDNTMPESLQEILRNQGFLSHLSRVTAIPSPDCVYSQTNVFHIPMIFQAQTAAS